MTSVDRIAGALLGTFVGDALGRPFEGTPAADRALLARRVRARARAPRHWLYTDDTEMMIAVAESLVRRRGVDPHDILAALAVGCDPARGYGRGMRRIVEAARRKVGTVDPGATWSEGSSGPGGAARVAPIAAWIALTAPPDARAPALDVAVLEATRVTHVHPDGIDGARLAAHAILLALEGAGGGARDVRSFSAELARRMGDPAHVARVSPGWDASAPAVNAIDVSTAAVGAFLAHPLRFEDTVVAAVSLGGDTDTAGAIAGAIAGAYHGASAIPASWRGALENGPRGRTYVVGLAEALVRVARRP